MTNNQNAAVKIIWKIPTIASPPKTMAIKININIIAINVMKQSDKVVVIPSYILCRILF